MTWTEYLCEQQLSPYRQKELLVPLAGRVAVSVFPDFAMSTAYIVPASLRKQWHQELAEKFFLPSVILETKTFNEQIREGVSDLLGI